MAVAMAEGGRGFGQLGMVSYISDKERGSADGLGWDEMEWEVIV